MEQEIRKAVQEHYDRLVKAGDDPVWDSEELKRYMEKWDGQEFLADIQPDPAKDVLEIGVGTGRLAVQVAPLCKSFTGIDLSLETIHRAENNLSGMGQVQLLWGDFLTYEFSQTFHVIYSSLTFLHIKEKQAALHKISLLLKEHGRLVLSIDKNQEEFLDTGISKIRTFPDQPEQIRQGLLIAGLSLIRQYETGFAWIFTAEKRGKENVVYPQNS